MALPLMYNVLSLRARWKTTLIAILGIAGTVGVFVAMLALARGFRAALVTSGSPHNAMVRRGGATSEMDSAITLEEFRIIADSPEVARGSEGPLASPEVVVMAALPLKASGTDANVQVRGVGLRALAVHDNVHLTAGRFFEPGMFELLVGHNANLSYTGLGLDQSIQLGGKDWKVVGVFDAGGSALDSEIWADADLLNPTYQRPRGIAQTVVLRLATDDSLDALKARMEGDPRVTARAERETDYYARASQQMTGMITILGSMVAVVMGIGAVFAALNTMYSAVSERSREIATLRALGFGTSSVVVAFLCEALFIAAVGGIVGCIAVLPVNGLTTGTLNFQTFSHISFAFRITLPLLGLGLGFALLMGLVGGLPPALRAARLPITVALRDM